MSMRRPRFKDFGLAPMLVRARVRVPLFLEREAGFSGGSNPPAPFDSAEDGLAHGGPFLVESCFASHHVRTIQITSNTRSKRLCTPLKTSTSSGSKWVPALREMPRHAAS